MNGNFLNSQQDVYLDVAHYALDISIISILIHLLNNIDHKN